MRRRLLGVLVPVIALGSLAAAPRPPAITFADAPGPFLLQCPGVTFQAVALGGGTFAPAGAVDGSRVFVPTQFGPGSSRGEDSEGHVWVGDYFGTYSKGESTTRTDASVKCGYTWTTTGAVASGLTWTETFWGSVIGKLSPAG